MPTNFREPYAGAGYKPQLEMKVICFEDWLRHAPLRRPESERHRVAARRHRGRAALMHFRGRHGGSTGAPEARGSPRRPEPARLRRRLDLRTPDLVACLLGDL